ncbi:actin cortical patch SUR7/pH-response regulator pali [Cokeromyces recurvatus]|uniref:actin cortical patch SUR7/pH-response regulator pali n=1 Tax=Cokeromyces recurvatus TaxID=90255 RepID=UPI00221E7A53|nr:actin cortical patch SUR7/pH-response regulator pali [Cokeromyces recurvatus]KAI7907969.1 actin cortical patch SUR7/pH-response regulator pali [Cokeromyces recurvatus]
MALFGYLATFFTFAALVLQVFSMIGTTYNRPFLRDLYFAKVTIRNDFYIFGLWSYCTGDIRSRDSSSFVVESCSKPVPAFDWTNTEGINRYFRDIGDLHKLFLADFILYWIALGFTLLALIITIMSHFRRGPDLLASLMTFIAFIIQMVVFIIMLVVGIRGVNAVKSYDPDIANGQLGPSMWMTLGAFVALLISSIAYCFACIFGRGRTHSGEKA